MLHKERLVNNVTMEIVGRFEGKNRDHKNRGGLVLEIKSSSGAREEFSRIAVERSNSTNPETPYAEQVRSEIDKAVTTVNAINELLAGASKDALR